MQIEAFKAFRFDAEAVGNVGNCIAPPYDVINDAQREQLYQKSRHNLVRIIKGKTNSSDNGQDNQYTRAADYLARWIEEGALKQDSAEAIYAYVQDFEVAGTKYQRRSFIALARLEDFGQIVKPHEQVLYKPMVDRLNLKQATAADLGLVFMLYEDRQKIADRIMAQAAEQQSLIDFVDEQDVRHRLFAITLKDDIEQIVKMMSDKSCIIADGHHRYTTGLTYLKESSNPAAKYQMLAFANMYQDGLIVLATHRLAGNLENFDMKKLIEELGEKFRITKFEFDSAQTKEQAEQEMLEQMRAEHDKDESAFGIYGSDNAFYTAVLKDKQMMDSIVPDMSPAWKTLDVSILHKLILEELLGIDQEKLAEGENLQYVKDTPNAIADSIAQIDAGQMQVAFFMNPIKLQQLKMVTEAGERMPQKSTYFYPKVYTGLTINKL
ncbi:MAG: DUF1015 domain-containing protein [Sedimentisphaerales bacterium]|nr:DUF1015 domain-containing protein [Sedimentisphaerales bacterium]